jgi:hypothetical protein
MFRPLLAYMLLCCALAVAAPIPTPPQPPFTPGPVIEWAKPMPGAPVRILCLLQGAKEEGLELQRRFNFPGEVLLGGGGKYGVKSTASTIARKHLTAGDVEVFIVGGIYWKSLPPTLRLAILERVEKGMGLLLVDSHPNWWDTTLPQVMAADPAPEAAAAVTNGIPLDLLPLVTMDPGRNAYCLYPDTEHPAPTPEQLVTAARFGKGRICILNYSVAQSNVVYLYSLTPGVRIHNAPFARSYPYWEYCHSLLGKAVRWCGQREPDLSMQVQGSFTNQRPAVARVTLSSPTARTVELFAEVRDRYHDLLGTARGTVALTPRKEATWEAKVPVAAYPPDGLYFVNVWARQDGKVLDWATTVGEAMGTERVSVTLDRPRYGRSEPVCATIACFGSLPGKMLQVELVGTDGRVLQREMGPAKPTQTLSFSLAGAQTLVSRVVAELRTGTSILSREQATVFLAPGPPDEFFAYSWMEAEAYYTRDYLRRIQDQGVNAVLAGGGAATYFFQGGRMANEVNLRLVPTNCVDSRLGKAPDGDPAKLPRPLTDPKIMAEETKRLRNVVPLVADSQPLGYSLMDEWALGWSNRPTDYSEASLVAFRQWIKGLYPNIAALNAEWGSPFASWEAVTPLQVKDLPKTTDLTNANLAPFVDYRLFMDTVGPTAFGSFAQTIRDMDPGAQVGLCGTESNGTWYGHEWFRLCGALDFFAGYGDAAADQIISRGMRGLQRELQRSFRRPGTLLSCWVGYHETDFYRDQALKLLLHDFNGIAYFAGNPAIFADFPYLDYDFTLSRRALLAGACTDEIRRGLDQLLWSSTRDNSGIAILLSPASQHVASALGQEGPWGEAVVAMTQAVEDSGYQHDFIAPQQLAAAVLPDRGYKAVLLPRVTCLSEGEIAALDQFAAAGGAIITDLPPGVLDGHGRARPRPPTWTGPNIITLGALPAERQQRQGLMGETLQRLGLRPFAKIEHEGTDHIPTETICYRNGDHLLVSVQTEWLANAQPDTPATITLPREGFVYDVREGKALGKTGTVKAKLDRDHILLYAILPHEVRGLRVTPATATVKQGEALTVKVQVEASAAPGRHFVRLTLPGHPGFARTLRAENGVAQTVLRLALNDPPGKWQIEARDAETGVVGRATFEVKPAGR